MLRFSLLLLLFTCSIFTCAAQIAIGGSKEAINCAVPGVGMMGYGDVENTIESNERPIYSRAFVIQEENGKELAMVCSELCSISQAVKDAVIKQLEANFPGIYSDENVWLTAQHTHSAAAGYIHYPIYSSTAVGFQPEVFDAIVESIVAAISSARAKLKPGKISMHQDAFPDTVGVAWNRSIKAYNRNPDVEHFSKHETHLALDRNMYQLNFESLDGDPIGILNWFGVHCTSVGKKNHDMNSDNKGWASEFFEEKIGDDFIAVFAQGTSGDVSPYYHGPKEWKKRKAIADQDAENSKINGRMQFDQAYEIYQEEQRILEGELDYAMMHIDMSAIHCDPAFTEGDSSAYTASGALGVAFFRGTKVDGLGMPGVLAAVTNTWANCIKARRKIGHWFRSKEKRQALRAYYRAQGRKKMLMETGEKKVLGYSKINRLPVPRAADPAIRSLKVQYENGALEENTWVQEIIPIQLIVLGDIAIAAIPTEITTTAGKRLRNTIQEILAKRGVNQVIIAPYSNSYIGYITTHQEYKRQEYEGGHTVHGQWSLAALQTKFTYLAEQLLLPAEDRKFPNLQPPTFSEEELSKRTKLELFPNKK